MSDANDNTRLIKENNYLRGLIPKITGKCVHCGLEDMAKCASGFPGCAWADDLMIAKDDILTQLRTENQSLRTQLEEKESESAVIRDVLRQCKETLVKASNMHDMVKCSNFIDQFVLAFPIDKALSTSAGKAYQARMEEAVRLLSEISPAAFASTSNPSNWLKRRDAILEQLKGTKANE